MPPFSPPAAPTYPPSKPTHVPPTIKLVTSFSLILFIIIGIMYLDMQMHTGAYNLPHVFLSFVCICVDDVKLTTLHGTTSKDGLCLHEANYTSPSIY